MNNWIGQLSATCQPSATGHTGATGYTGTTGYTGVTGYNGFTMYQFTQQGSLVVNKQQLLSKLFTKVGI